MYVWCLMCVCVYAWCLICLLFFIYLKVQNMYESNAINFVEKVSRNQVILQWLHINQNYFGFLFTTLALSSSVLQIATLSEYSFLLLAFHHISTFLFNFVSCWTLLLFLISSFLFCPILLDLLNQSIKPAPFYLPFSFNPYRESLQKIKNYI